MIQATCYRVLMFDRAQRLHWAYTVLGDELMTATERAEHIYPARTVLEAWPMHPVHDHETYRSGPYRMIRHD